ncbi:hypothetical protein BUALT_Bualt03G0210000 [Buddleja alternifolia]|uniref:Transcription factor n=1 Tax=Buddleja alternifolia TaxID=168488 RepID=A0AAV6Y6B6_9LAMI|nr:hypothetical protein BUALT_Bualt03G0210000 [Buddleja alternifolia]
MAPDVSGGLRNSSSAVKSRHVLKKGPWTTSEDMMLVDYVRKHGEGNWNAVQRNSGLMRCGKSCRLRWANHLRPNLKKGAFTADEEQLIVDLHAKIGNKWARMAAQLPGRTDNEIKNYWNTRLKRRHRAGLPIYPQEHHQEQPVNSPPPPPSSSFSSLLASSHPPNPNPLNFFDTFNYQSSIINPSHKTQYLNPQLKLYRGNNGSLALSLNNSSFSSPVAPAFFNQGLENPLSLTPSLFQYNSVGFGINSGPGMGVLGLPSIQSSPAGSSSEVVMANSSDGEVEPGFSRRNNSGLLEDLLEESQALACAEKPDEDTFIAVDGNHVHEKAAFEFGHGNDNSGNNYEGKEAKAPGEGVNITAMDDDLLNLLDNFPLSVPIPDWDEGNGSEAPILTNGTNDAIESQPNASQYNPVAASSGTTNQDWNNFGSCLWNNMPSIY